MENIKNIAEVEVSSMDSYFFDNNVWMYLFCPIANVHAKKQKEYSDFLAKIQSRNATIFVTSMVLSEFANSFLRLDYKLWQKDNNFYDKDYKRDYLHSNRYKVASISVISGINSILKISEKYPDNFNAIEISTVLEYFKIIDFNDSYYVQLCKEAKLKIVTDDKDFNLVNIGNAIVISSL